MKRRRKYRGANSLSDSSTISLTIVFQLSLYTCGLLGTVAHKYHDKTFFLTAKLSFSRQNSHFSRQNSLSHGKTLFLTAKLSFSRQNSLSHGKTLFSHGKTFFLTAKLFLMAERSFVEYNIRSDEETCSESEEKER